MKNLASHAFWVCKIASGCALFALGFDLFLIPNGLTAGGISGIAMIIAHVLKFGSVGVISAMINLPLFFAGGKLLFGIFKHRKIQVDAFAFDKLIGLAIFVYRNNV